MLFLRQLLIYRNFSHVAEAIANHSTMNFEEDQ